MSDFNSLEKEYLRPDYSEEEDISFDKDIGPSEDDDDDDINDYDEGEEEKEIERISKDQDKLREKIMTQTPFGQPAGGSSPWPQSNTSQPWGGSSNPWGGGSSNQPSWGAQRSPTWGGGGGTPQWGGGSTWSGSGTVSGKREIDRHKEVVFCDVLDCLIETIDSNGRPGFLPRGIYDIKIKFDVWNKIACFNPRKVFAIIPRNLILSSNGYNSWTVLLDYIICSLSEFLRVPYGSCQILTQKDFSQGKEVIIKATLMSEKIDKNSAIQIGLESGLFGQSNRDILAAERAGIEYIDLGQLMSLYY